MTAHRRGWSSAESEKYPEARYVMNPEPVFDGVEEMHRYEDAWAETPRLAGETLAEHMARVVAKATAGQREPGADDE